MMLIYEEPGSRQRVWQEQRLCEAPVEIRRTVGGRVPGRDHQHHDDKDGEGDDDLDSDHLHLPTCRMSSSLATKTKKRMVETRAAMTMRIPQKSPELELRQSTEYLQAIFCRQL